MFFSSPHVPVSVLVACACVTCCPCHDMLSVFSSASLYITCGCGDTRTHEVIYTTESPPSTPTISRQGGAAFMANPAFRPDSEGRTLKDNEIIRGNYLLVRSRSGLPDSESWKPGLLPLFARLALPSPDIGRQRVYRTCLWNLS
eukprot:scaffold3554_cov61-Phaeocystis_antarctica.AAC.1